MFINAYGHDNDPVMILLAPMMVSGAELYQLMKLYLKNNYYIIAPDQGGHGQAGSYISADDEYQQLKSWLIERGYTKITMLYGASLGVAVAYRLFIDEDFEVAHAWFDGVALCRHARFAEWFMKKLFRSRKKTLVKTNVIASKSLVKMYGYDFAAMMTQNFKRITINDIDAICAACCHYDLKKLSSSQQRTLHLDFGEKDFDLRYSKKTIPQYFSEAELTIRQGYGHCAYMAHHTKAYVEALEQMIVNN